jgi:tetratricopeptide (TPR) repeat protein
MSQPLPRLAFVIGCLLVTTPPAVANSTTAGAREHYHRGTVAFNLGHYEEAAGEYEEAYRLKDDPALLYNIAQARRLAGNSREALRSYRTFLRLVPGAPNRAEVEGRIAELQKVIELETKRQALQTDGASPPKSETPASEAKVVAPTAAEPKAVAPKGMAVSASAVPPERRRAAPWYRDAVVLGLGAVGVAAIGAGVGLAAYGSVLKGRSDGATDLGQRTTWYHDASVYSITGYALLGAGVLVGVGAVTAAVVHRRAATRRYALDFGASPNSVFAGLQGGF